MVGYLWTDSFLARIIPANQILANGSLSFAGVLDSYALHLDGILSASARINTLML